MPTDVYDVFEFGGVVFRTADRSLEHGGKRQDLRAKAAEVLTVLLRANGGVVTKAELLDAVWPDADVNENNLSQQIRALRVALENSATGEAFIGTVRKLGYRIVPTITLRREARAALVPLLVTEAHSSERNGAGAGSAAAIQSAVPETVAESRHVIDGAFAPPMAHRTMEADRDEHTGQARQLPSEDIEPRLNPVAPGPSPLDRSPLILGRPLFVGTVLLTCIGAAVALGLSRGGARASTFRPVVASYQVIATGLVAPALEQPLLTDGEHVYLELNGKPAAVSVKDGQVSVPGQLRDYRLNDLSPARDQFLAARRHDAGADWALVALSRGGELAHRLGLLRSELGATWSRDGARIAYAQDASLYVARSDGAQPTTVTTDPGRPRWPRWSPDGRKLRYSLGIRNDRMNRGELWEVGIDGTGRHPVLAEGNDEVSVCCGNWSPDGRLYVFAGTQRERSYLWLLDEGAGGPPRTAQRPVRVTGAPSNLYAPVFSVDGQRIFALGLDDEYELVRYDPTTHGFTPYLGGMSASWVTFSRDKRWVAYVAHPQRTLWRSRIDGTEKRQLTPDGMIVDSLSWSPDGQTIAFRMGATEAQEKIFLIDADGTSLRPITEGAVVQGMPTWSENGDYLAFSDVPEVFGHPTGSEVIHIYDLKQKRISSLPGSEGLWTARWSPDGRSLAALTIDLPLKQRLMLYDFKTRVWRSTGVEHVSTPTWSSDNKYIYFCTEGGTSMLKRVRVADGVAETLFDLGAEAPLAAGATANSWWWTGLSHDDSPIVLRKPGGARLYALELAK